MEPVGLALAGISLVVTLPTTCRLKFVERGQHDVVLKNVGGTGKQIKVVLTFGLAAVTGRCVNGINIICHDQQSLTLIENMTIRNEVDASKIMEILEGRKLACFYETESGDLLEKWSFYHFVPATWGLDPRLGDCIRMLKDLKKGEGYGEIRCSFDQSFIISVDLYMLYAFGLTHPANLAKFERILYYWQGPGELDDATVFRLMKQGTSTASPARGSPSPARTSTTNASRPASTTTRGSTTVRGSTRGNTTTARGSPSSRGNNTTSRPASTTTTRGSTTVRGSTRGNTTTARGNTTTARGSPNTQRNNTGTRPTSTTRGNTASAQRR